MRSLAWVWVLGIATVLVACTSKMVAPAPRSGGPAVVEERTVSFATSAELAPETVPYQRASLILSGTSVPVDVKPVLAEGSLELRLVAHGEHLMEEKYVFNPSSFAFAGSSGEKYDPPITLLRFPYKSTDDLSWKGKVSYGERTDDADGTIKAKPETLNLAGGNFETLNVTVTLSYKGGGSKPTVRPLRFWFVPKKGLIKRDFGLSSTREPVPATVGDAP